MTSHRSKTASPKLGTRPSGFRANSALAPAANPATATTSSTPGPPAAAPMMTNARNAPPMKKRSKGSGFLSAIFVTAFIAFGYVGWSTLLQYQAYGVIEGRVISVAAPWDGSIATWQVRDGEEVKQGQVLAMIKNIDMEHELATLGDELKMNQALLEAEISKVEFEVENRTDRKQKAIAEYHETYGELLAEEEKQKVLERKFERTRRLLKSNNVSQSAYEEIFYKVAGQKKKIEQLADAVEILKYRSERSETSNGSSRLKPILAQIELTKLAIARLRERIAQGHIQSPVNGRVSKRHRLTGESARAAEPVIDILEEDSIQAVLYLPQKVVDEYEVGKEVEVALEPYTHSMKCVVERFGDRFEQAPETIQRFYYVNQSLLPVYLTPTEDTEHMLAARVGGTIKRPYDYKKAFRSSYEDAKGFVFGLIGSPSPSPATTVKLHSVEQANFDNMTQGESSPELTTNTILASSNVTLLETRAQDTSQLDDQLSLGKTMSLPEQQQPSESSPNF